MSWVTTQKAGEAGRGGMGGGGWGDRQRGRVGGGEEVEGGEAG